MNFPNSPYLFLSLSFSISRSLAFCLCVSLYLSNPNVLRCGTSFETRSRSETVGCVFLQRRSDARRIYATVVHAKANVDGYKEQGITFPNGETQEMLLREVYCESGVDPTKIEYVEAHGTGTKVCLLSPEQIYISLQRLTPFGPGPPRGWFCYCMLLRGRVPFTTLHSQVGDPQELAALSSVFCRGREGPLQIGSVKTNCGHAEGEQRQFIVL